MQIDEIKDVPVPTNAIQIAASGREGQIRVSNYTSTGTAQAMSVDLHFVAVPDGEQPCAQSGSCPRNLQVLSPAAGVTVSYRSLSPYHDARVSGSISVGNVTRLVRNKVIGFIEQEGFKEMVMARA